MSLGTRSACPWLPPCVSWLPEVLGSADRCRTQGGSLPPLRARQSSPVRSPASPPGFSFSAPRALAPRLMPYVFRSLVASWPRTGTKSTFYTHIHTHCARVYTHACAQVPDKPSVQAPSSGGRCTCFTSGHTFCGPCSLAWPLSEQKEAVTPSRRGLKSLAGPRGPAGQAVLPDGRRRGRLQYLPEVQS